MSTEIGDRIRKLLDIQCQGNQSELARYVKVTPQAVQQWLSGNTMPKGKNLAKICEFFKVSPAYLSFGEPPIADNKVKFLTKKQLYIRQITDDLEKMEEGDLEKMKSVAEAFAGHRKSNKKTKANN